MLKYLGGGFLDGVPARDLSDEEASKFDIKVLVQSGLYKKVTDIEVKHGNQGAKKNIDR